MVTYGIGERPLQRPADSPIQAGVGNVAVHLGIVDLCQAIRNRAGKKVKRGKNKLHTKSLILVLPWP